MERQLRRRAGMPKKMSRARTAPLPALSQPFPGIFGRANSAVTGAAVPMVKVTVPLALDEVRVTAVPPPPPVHVVPSPPDAVVLVCWQVRETEPVYPAVAATVTVTVADWPGVTLDELGAPAVSLKVDSVTVTCAVLVPVA
jgi:hypothetical protein